MSGDNYKSTNLDDVVDMEDCKEKVHGGESEGETVQRPSRIMLKYLIHESIYAVQYVLFTTYGARSTPRAARSTGALTKRAAGPEFGVRSHGAGLLEAEPSGERRLASRPPHPSPGTRRPPPPGRARPARTQPPRTAAHRVPAPPHPRRAQSPVRTKQTTRPPPPSFLSPLTAWPPATSAVHAPNGGSLRGQSAAGPPRGPPGDPPAALTPAASGVGEPNCLRGVKVVIMQPPPPLAGQLGKVGSPPRRASPRSPRPRSLSSPPRALGAAGEPREPPAPGSQLRARSRHRPGSGRPQRRVFAPPPPHAAPRALSPPPTHLARRPSPRGPAPPRQEGRTLFAPVRPPLPASAAWSVRSGGRGREAGVAAVPEPPPLSRPAPARPSPTRT
ncbi:basic proline-rich protein-like [Diceros bicornis minor]|uniref:basic proline-rich protein-like n=1 Tax=Diceros bicornis minor TaxID=77932 RepID=UPI0026E9B148|nr:basic proline-rich protein-like [Diceros bicornis minor]